MADVGSLFEACDTRPMVLDFDPCLWCNISSDTINIHSIIF